MRIRKTVMVFMTIMAVSAGLSYGQISRQGQELEPCRLIISVIQRQFEGIDKALDRLGELARAGSDADREKIRQLRGHLEEAMNSLKDEYDRVLGEVDLSCDDCVARACLAMRPKLVQVRDRLAASLQDLLREETAIRMRIATVKRIGLAIRATDRALFRAAQLAKKTDSGVEAFPGLRRAFEVQEEAKQVLAAGRLEGAMKLTLRARDLIGETMREALDSADIAAVCERAKEFWKQTNVMIKRVEKRIDEEKNPRAARLIEMAKQEQEKARELADEHCYQALRHAQAARRMVNEMVQFNMRAKNCEDRTDILARRIEEATQAVEESGDEKAAEILQSAVQHYEKGKDLCGQEKAGEATVQFDIAAKLTAKAVDIAKGNTPKNAMLKREIRKTMLIVKKAESVAQTDAQKQKVENAQQLVRKAGETIDKPEACLKLLDRATDLALAVIAEAGKPQVDDASQSGE